MKYRIDFTEDEYNELLSLLESRIEGGGSSQTMVRLVKLFEKIDENYQEVEELKKEVIKGYHDVAKFYKD